MITAHRMWSKSKLRQADNLVGTKNLYALNKNNNETVSRIPNRCVKGNFTSTRGFVWGTYVTMSWVDAKMFTLQFNTRDTTITGLYKNFINLKDRLKLYFID